MSLARTVDAMVAAGCTAEQVAAVVRAHEAERQEKDQVRRAKDATRKRMSRMSRGQAVTAQDTPLFPPNKEPPTPQEINPPYTPRCAANARDPLESRVGDMLDALGVTDETKSAGFLSLSEPYRWIAGGCDVDLDVLPALRGIRARGKAPRSWSYCTASVFEARDNRLLPPPEPKQRATGPPEQRKPRNAGEAARLELIRRGEYPNATDDSARHDNQGDRNAGFAGTDIARRIAIASSR